MRIHYKLLTIDRYFYIRSYYYYMIMINAIKKDGKVFYLPKIVFISLLNFKVL